MMHFKRRYYEILCSYWVFCFVVWGFFETNSILNTILLQFYTRKKKNRKLYLLDKYIDLPCLSNNKIWFCASTGLISIY